MRTVLAKWFIKPGKVDEARDALRALADAVETGEPGTLTYMIHLGKSGSLPPTAPGEVVFVEVYENEDAFQAHISGPIFQGFLKDHGALFEQNFPPNIGPFMETAALDRIAGFAERPT